MSVGDRASQSGRVARLIAGMELALLFGVGLSFTVVWYAAMLWVGYRVVLWLYGSF